MQQQQQRDKPKALSPPDLHIYMKRPAALVVVVVGKPCKWTAINTQFKYLNISVRRDTVLLLLQNRGHWQFTL